MTLDPPRRVVTGLDAQGRSAIVIDGPAQSIAWSTNSFPVDNGGNGDTGSSDLSIAFRRDGTAFAIVDIPPGEGLYGLGMHATNTIDYLIVVAGSIVLLTETAETQLNPGDLIVDRGILHGWRNDGDVPVRLVGVVIEAAPVGDGATI